MTMMKGLRFSYISCAALEVARFVFLFLWSGAFFPWSGEPHQNLPFLILAAPGFLLWVQFALLAYDPLTNAAMAKGQIAVKGLELAPQVLLLVTGFHGGEPTALWLWATSVADLAIFWLLVFLCLGRVSKSQGAQNEPGSVETVVQEKE